MGQNEKGVCVVADDDPVVLEDLCERLQSSHEFQDVRPFGRISEAIAYIQTHPVALFITDIEFPDGQLGFKHLSDVPFTPVILMSVHSRYMLEHIADNCCQQESGRVCAEAGHGGCLPCDNPKIQSHQG